ncbi:MAG: DUF523 domain-containing protein [Desulfovibrionaceae bacterium]|nr:DUF523 domain-containing protein [Desulfovibrionaceae bacterium]
MIFPKYLYVVSACLVRETTRYDGRSNFLPQVYELYLKGDCLALCPERLLGIPRLPLELRGNLAIRRDGLDVTTKLEAGVKEAMEQVLKAKAKIAILKSRSPSCGVGEIYDGSFSHTLVAGDGLWAKALKACGLKLILAENFAEDYN